MPMVYNLKARKKMGKHRKKAEAGGQTIGLSITHMLAAKKLVDQAGGIGGFHPTTVGVSGLPKVDPAVRDGIRAKLVGK